MRIGTVKKITALIIYTAAFLFHGLHAAAQKEYVAGLKDITTFWEINITTGANNFLGDLGGTQGEGRPFLKDYTMKTLRPLVGLGVQYTPKRWFALNAGFNFTKVVGIDSLINNDGGQERWRYNRNLSFKSNIFEAYAGVIFYPMQFFEKRYEVRTVEPILGVHLGVFHFNPQANLNGEWVKLQPLRLEGQGSTEYPDRKPYTLTQIYYPATVGVKIYFNNRYALSTGFIFRQTKTDYIDDISTTYIDPTLFDKYLTSSNASIAKQLYARSRQPWKVRPDVEKAHSYDNDSYTTYFFQLNIRIDKRINIYYPKL